MSRVNQCALLLNHLMRRGRVTKEEAEKLGIRNLSARVWTLRYLGCELVTIPDGYALKKQDRPAAQQKIDMEGCLFPEYIKELYGIQQQ